MPKASQEKGIKLTQNHLQPIGDVTLTEALNYCFNAIDAVCKQIIATASNKLEQGEITEEQYEAMRDDLHDQIVVNLSIVANNVKEIVEEDEVVEPEEEEQK